MIFLWIWMRIVHRVSYKLGSTCSRICTYLYGYATLTTYSKHRIPCIFSTYRTADVVWIFTLLYSCSSSSITSCVCSRSSMLSSISGMSSLNLGTNKLFENICNSYSYRSCRNSYMFWRSSYGSWFCKPSRTPSYCSRRKLCCCRYASSMM